MLCVTALLLAVLSARATTLGTAGSHFTVDGEPRFLLGISYYGGLGAPEEYVRQDLDEAQRHGFNWVRVWATWGQPADDVSAVDANGAAREPYLGRLEALVSECDGRGMIVDVTLTRSRRRLAGYEAHERAVRTLLAALASHRNWYLDLGNERDVRDDRFVSIDDLRRLRAVVRELDPARVVTASFGGHDPAGSEVRDMVSTAGVDFLAVHRPRHAGTAEETEARTQQCLAELRHLGREIPVHQQEPFRRGYERWEPVAADFLADLRGAVRGGAAGWCFHNGSERATPDHQPGRSFDLRERRLFDQLDVEERKVVSEASATARAAAQPVWIGSLSWAPASSIVRRAKGSDNWPMTWSDDDLLYTAYGDGNGFEPFLKEKLSLGLARVRGGPTNFIGENLRSTGMEQKGDGERGLKASGILMVDGTLYLWVRNAGNSRLAWSADHGTNWTWADWRFTSSFGCPTFLNFGGNYAGARDQYVYLYSADSDGAYLGADRMVLARMPRVKIRERDAYEFFVRLDKGKAVWTRDIKQRGAVFTDAARCYRSGITYSAGLRSYLWVQIFPQSRHPQGPRFQGGFAVRQAPEPWGPWSVVFTTNDWDVGPGETASFPTKWMSPDGREIWLVFSGNDSFSVRKATINPQAENGTRR